MALEAMQAKLDALEYAKKEPIAIIGMGCRFPGGADNPEAFWQLLREGVDAITDVPSYRWNIEAFYDPNPDIPGKIYTRKGGFLNQVDTFNPQFFGISATEAKSLDPQQRLLLEVGWEALENANQPSEKLLNSLTGVFIGICSNDYNNMIWKAGGATQVDAFCATGNALSVAAGRLSYALGLKGPSLAIDTACSSSLVAVHMACQHLRNQECNLALAGGVHLLLSPETSVAFARTRMLDPDGRCKTFDADANGYVRGEGCGVVILKRMSDALADGDNILAVIRGSAVNHNGRSSSLVAPNGPSQQTLIRQTLENAGVEPSQVSYVEVQGTGTSLGQPIEVEALAAVYGENRNQDNLLVIGSVKTNIGHLEAASGMASIIKVILAMQHQQIPPHLHFHRPNPYIEWDKLPVTVPTQLTPWNVEGKRLAGVSAFGFSGTNAHVLLESASLKENPKSLEPCLHLLTLSAKTEESLIGLAQQYEKYLTSNLELDLGDICFTANTRRSQFQYRLGIIASSTTELASKLTASITGKEVEGVVKGKATSNAEIDLSSLNLYLDDRQQFLINLAKSYITGAKIDWSVVDINNSYQLLQLPTYAWQRQRYWVENTHNQHKQQINPKSITVTEIQAWLISQIARELGIQPDDINIKLPFDSYGLDSVLAISIASAGEKFLGLSIYPLMLVHYPTIELLSQHLATELATSETEVFEI